MIPGIAINQRYGLTVPVVRSINRLRLHEVVEYPAHQREERGIGVHILHLGCADKLVVYLIA